ncbi:TPA: hypothetical protein ACOEEB_000608 [Enterobacter asburiae]
MITFTKEQLIASAHARIEFAEMMLAGELEPLKERTWSIELELARIALASLEAEVVGEVVLGEYDDSGCHPDARVVCIAADGQADWENFKDGTRLYAAPSAPVMPDSGREQFEEWFKFHHGEEGSIVTLHRANGDANYRDEFVDLAWIAWKDSRAAMLQGAENAESLHAVKSAPLLDSSEKGIELQHADFQTKADVNPPVIPDGWVLVPVEPTMSQEFAGYRTLTDTGKMSRLMKTRLSNIYRAMVAAAPQQELK